ncbi:MAG: hypothetical protein E6471_13975 [Bradyrhizobium sp.]|nr:hypothetical protein [Bradyrhizobium sp.]
MVDVGGLQLDAVQHLAVMKARTRFVGVGEARAERRLLVGAEDAEIAQREVLETIGRLAEIEIQQKFDRPCVVERYEASGAAMLRGKIEGDCRDEEVGQRRLRPGRADLAAKSGRTGTVEERRLRQAEHEGGVVLGAKTARLATVDQVLSRGLEIGDLLVLEQRAIEDRPAPVDHPDQETLRVLGEAARALRERMIFIGEDLAIRRLDELEHFDEMVEVIIDRQRGELHVRCAGLLTMLVNEPAFREQASGFVVHFLF